MHYLQTGDVPHALAMLSSYEIHSLASCSSLLKHLYYEPREDVRSVI